MEILLCNMIFRLKNNTNEITLPLIGGNISDILVKNYLSKYLGYSFNSVTNEIKIDTNESQLRIILPNSGSC